MAIRKPSVLPPQPSSSEPEPPAALPPEPPESNGPEPPPEPPRLPVGTRISLYYILLFLVFLIGGPLVALVALSPEKRAALIAEEVELEISLLLWIEALLMPAILGATIGFVHFVDRKPIHAIGALPRPGEVGRTLRWTAAAVLGAVVLLVVWRTLARLQARIDAVGPGDAVPGQLALLALGFVASAVVQEWPLRGYIYSALREKLSWVHAAGITSILLAFLHLPTAGVDAAGLLAVFFLGLVMSALRELSGSVWPPVLFQAAWSFTLGALLSLPLAGADVPSLATVEVSGPEGWTGGDYGPEGSWALCALLLGAVLVLGGVLSRDDEVENQAEDDDPGP